MIGPLEVLIVLVIVLLVFGGYRMLPALGRSAGKGVRQGRERARELAATASSKAEGTDTEGIARSAGEGVREARELREAVTGGGKPSSAEATKDGEKRSSGT